jgi:hypothetical protein
MKIADYTTSDAKALDRLVATDADTGATKNVTAEDLANFSFEGQYKAILNQGTTNPPVAVLYPNNLITGSYAYSSTGTYVFTSDTAFASNVVLSHGAVSGPTTTITMVKTGVDTVMIQTYASGVLTNGLLADQYIEIKSFNA